MKGSPPHRQRWAVVGGGVTGLGICRRLLAAGQEVVLYESAEVLGGLASAWHLGPIVWDRHYHVTLLSDTFTRAFLRDLDLESEMEWVETKTGFLTGGRLHPLTSSLDYLRLPGVSPIGKARLAATILWSSRQESTERYRHVPVDQWLRRWSGNATFEKIWLPLLRCKLGEAYRRTAASFICATIRRVYQARRTGLKKEMFGYVPGGYGRVLERSAEVLRERGAELRLGRGVRRIESSHGGLELESSDGMVDRFDRVVVTTPPRIAAGMAPGLREDEREHLRGVYYQGLVCASVLLRRPLSQYYLCYLTGMDLPFTAVVEMSSIVDRRHFGGHSLVYLPKYTSPDDPLFKEPDEVVEQSFLEGLGRVHPHFDRDDVLAFQVSRVREVFPVPTFEGRTDPPPILSSVPGLSFVNSSQIVDGTLNVNDSLRFADAAVELLLQQSPAQSADLAR